MRNGSPPPTARLRVGVGALIRSSLPDLPVLVLMAVVVIVSTAFVAALPRNAQRAGDLSLERSLGTADVLTRSMRMVVIDRFAAGTSADPLGAIDRVMSRAAEQLPERVRSIYSAPDLMIDTPRFVVDAIDGSPPPFPTTVTLRIHEAIADLAVTVSGRPARPTTEAVEGAAVIEVGLTEESADRLGVGVGGELLIGPEFSEPISQRFGTYPFPAVLRVTEILELRSDADDAWFGNRRLHRPVVRDTALGAEIHVFAALRPAQLPSLVITEGGAALVAEWRFDLDADELTVEESELLVTDLKAIDAGSDQLSLRPGIPVFSTGLERLLTSERARRNLAAATLALASTAVAAVSIAVVAQLGRLGVTRGRRRLGLTRARGASRTQSATGGIIVIAAVTAPAAFIGWRTAVAIVPGPGARGAWGVVAVAVAAIAAASATSLAEARRPLGEVLRPVDVQARRSGRWVVFDGLVLVLAAAGVVTLGRRGIDPAAETGLDPLVVAAPLAAAVAAGLVVRRMVPMLSATMSRMASRSRGLGVLVGLRRAAHDPEVGASVVVVLVIAFAATALGLSLDRSIADGQVAASWELVAEGDPAFDRVEYLEELRSEPLVRATRHGFVLAVAAGLLMTTVAVAAALIVTARERTRQMALLGAVGAPGARVRGAVVAEMILPVVSSIAVGAAIGLLGSAALAGRLDLTPFTAASGATITPDVARTVFVAAVAVGASLLLMLVAIAVTRRGDPTRVLREIDAP